MSKMVGWAQQKKKSQCKNVNDLGSGKTSKYAGLNNTGPLKCGFFSINTICSSMHSAEGQQP